MIEFENEKKKEDFLFRLAFRLYLTRDLIEYNELYKICEELEPDDQERVKELRKDFIKLDAFSSAFMVIKPKINNLQKGN